MIVQHNIMALNSYNRLGTNNNAVQKNLEKLSSGYRINRAGDDAAGLAISEKMRAQITGLERAQLNAKDGISLVQTAEGALTEVHSMLNRLVELGVESANGIYQASDRDKIQAEVNQITEEIDRISESTNFNGIKLLDGSLGSSSAAISGGKDVTVTSIDPTKGSYTVGATLYDDTKNPKIASLTKGDTITLTVNTRINGSDQSKDFTITYDPDKHTTATDVDKALNAMLKDYYGSDFDIDTTTGKWEAKNAGADKAILKDMSITVREENGANGPTVTLKDIALTTSTPGKDASTTADMTNGKSDVDKDATLDTVKANTLEVNGKKYVMVADLDAAKMVNKLDSSIQTFIDYDDMAAAIQKDNGFTVTNNAGVLTLFSAAGSASGGKGLTLQVGDTADAFNKVTVSVDNMSSSGLNIQGLTVTDQGIAADSITRVKSAIEKVSVNRGRLGALQNRLEHTLNNLATTTENMTNAESRIRDTDMAQEMMAFTKNNVLVQAAQSMLAQANQQPQQVLQLLR